MIKSLYLKNFALISELTIDFEKGLNIITGESGSGKSLIFKSINYLLGDRFQKENIRDGTDQCIIEGEFYDGRSIFIRRLFKRNGQTRNFVNDSPVNLDELKKETWSFLDYHGQHENQRLFSPRTHLDYLDIFAGNSKLVNRISQEYRKIRKLETDLEYLKSENSKLNERLELLNFQLEEIESYPFTKETDSQITRKIMKYSNIVNLIDGIKTGLVSLNENENSIRAKLISAKRHIEDLSKIEPELKNLTDRIHSLILELDDIGTELEHHLQIDPPNTEELEILNLQLTHLEMLKRKYGGSLEAVLMTKNKIEDDLGRIKINTKNIGYLHSKIKTLRNKFNQIVGELSEKRRGSRFDYETSIRNNFNSLGMNNSIFTVEISEINEANETGIDKCEYFISSSKGDELKPLGKIISGGELARIQLAIKMVIGNKDSVDTLILDEIDSGISGRIAEFTGEVICRLSQHKQVICITHLPQIAGKGIVHFKTTKYDKRGYSIIGIDRLDKTGRVKEIASMISGEKITQSGKDRAKEILELN